MLRYNQSFVQMCLLIGTVSRVTDVAHKSLDRYLINYQIFLAILRFEWDDKLQTKEKTILLKSV